MVTASGPAGALRVKLTWVTVFRAVASTLLLTVFVARLVSSGRVNEQLATADAASFFLVASVYALTLVTALLLRVGRVGTGAAWAQVVADVVLASVLVFLSGGSESPFTFVYLLAIIEAATLLLRTGAVVATAASLVTFPLVVSLVQQGVLVSATGMPPRPLREVVFQTGSHVLAQILVAVLATYISEQLSRTGGQLLSREQDLRQLVDLQNQIVSEMPSGLVTCDAEGMVTYLNPAAAGILGVAQEVRGKASIDQLLPGMRALRPRQARAELNVPTPHGDRVLGLTVTPLSNADGSTLAVFQDLTDLKRVQAELRRIDHLASLGRVSAELAHEVRNPLASMRGSAQILVSDVAQGSQQERLARLIMREADRLSQLVESYLKLARPPPPSKNTGRLDELAKETIEMLRTDPGTSGRRIDGTLDAVEASFDGSQLKQVLTNLLRNALTATGDGGQVRVTTRRVDGFALLEVWDSAGSISTADQARLFEPFFTTSAGGTGLGLSTARTIVQAHGGSIEVSSAPQQGTTFTVRLPTT